jgi:hypothetical protein
MAARKKKRGPSLDDKYLGPEPIYTAEADVTSSAWTHGAHWYNYFYKTKDYMPTTYQFAADVMGYDKKKVSVLKRLKDWKFMKVNKIIKLYYRGWQYDDVMIQKCKDFIDELYKEGLTLKKIEEKKKAEVKVITPAERTRLKVLDTIYAEWDEDIVEGWLNGDFTKKFSAYNRFNQPSTISSSHSA